MTQQPSQYALAPARARSGEDPLYAFLKSARGGPVSLSCSNVRRIDAQRLQTLLVARRQWWLDGQAFGVSDMSDEFRAGLERLGLPTDHFDKDAQS